MFLVVALLLVLFALVYRNAITVQVLWVFINVEITLILFVNKMFFLVNHSSWQLIAFTHNFQMMNLADFLESEVKLF